MMDTINSIFEQFNALDFQVRAVIFAAFTLVSWAIVFFFACQVLSKMTHSGEE